MLHAIRQHLHLAAELKTLLDETAWEDLLRIRDRRLRRRIADKQREIDSHREFRMRLLEALHEGLIDRDEYGEMRDRYSQLISREQEALMRLKEQQAERTGEDNLGWIHQILRHQNLETLTRDAVVSLIDRVWVSEGKQVEIIFNFRDEIALWRQTLAGAEREAG